MLDFILTQPNTKLTLAPTLSAGSNNKLLRYYVLSILLIPVYHFARWNDGYIGGNIAVFGGLKPLNILN